MSGSCSVSLNLMLFAKLKVFCIRVTAPFLISFMLHVNDVPLSVQFLVDIIVDLVNVLIRLLFCQANDSS